MRILADILTPKQCLFLGILTKELEEKGHKVLRTTRRYREVNELLRLRGIDATTVGEHGGGTLHGKLVASAERIREMSDIASEWDPDIVISFASPEAARVAFGLNKFHVCINDTPHAEAVMRLTIPLSHMLFAPRIIPKEVWVPFGIDRERIFQYNAIDSVAWIRRMQPDINVVHQLGIDLDRPMIVVRPEEAQASYLLGKSMEEAPAVLSVIRELLGRKRGVQFIVIPRYVKQASTLRSSLDRFGERVRVLEEVVDATSLLSFSSLFIGAGGTMTSDATLLGIPAISCFPREPTLVEKFLIDQGLVHRANTDEDAVKKAMEILADLEAYRRRHRAKAKALLSSMEDPIGFITQKLGEFFEGM
ncbi:MAG: DUF354 domain-containing protein [Candidatus Geothermarchaeales archaeon]